MKRDMELIREILLAVEAGDDSSKISGYDPDLIKYHQALTIEAGLVDGVTSKSTSNTTKVANFISLRKLTWNGHEFIDAVRQDSIWNTVKTEFKDASMETIIKVSKQLAEGWAKKKVESLLIKDS